MKDTTMISHLDNFRSFGSNCEFGTVLEKAGFTGGGLLKNALVQDFAFIIAALDGNLEGMYKDSNLIPYDTRMVRDLKYGFCWHTKLRIGWVNGTLALVQPDEGRLAIVEQERDKLNYLVKKFLDELATQHKIYVLRSNQQIHIDIPRAILSRLHNHGQASIIVMKQSVGENGPGTVRVIEDGIYEGYLPHLSTSPNLEDVDHDGWIETCRTAWALHTSIQETKVRKAGPGIRLRPNNWKAWINRITGLSL